MLFRRVRCTFYACLVLLAVAALGACGADGSGDEGTEGSTSSSGPDGTTTSSAVAGGGTTASSSEAGGETTSTVTSTTRAADKGFTGEWQSTFGKLQLEASGDGVQGTYEFCAGTLTGTARGETVLEGTWKEDTSACQDPESAARDVADGTFSFTLDPGGDTFTGYYETTGSPERNEWSGTRIG